MKVSLTSVEVRQIISSMGECLIRDSAKLGELDATLADGDLGVTVTLGGKALKDAVDTVDTEDIGKFLIHCGVRFNQAAASTFGVLFATALIEGGKVAQGYTGLTLADIVRIAEAAEAAIRKRGNAELGHKTMLDAIVPAVEALRRANEGGLSIEKAVEMAAIAAGEGAEATKAMQSKVGRASYQGTKSIGHKDPGATAVHLLLEAVLSVLKPQ